jgi:hypothetical protein
MNCDDSAEAESVDERCAPGRRDKGMHPSMKGMPPPMLGMEEEGFKDEGMPPPMPGMDEDGNPCKMGGTYYSGPCADYQAEQDEGMPPPMPGMEEDMHGEGENFDETMIDCSEVDYEAADRNRQIEMGRVKRAQSAAPMWEESAGPTEEERQQEAQEKIVDECIRIRNQENNEQRQELSWSGGVPRENWTAEQEEIFLYNQGYFDCILSYWQNSDRTACITSPASSAVMIYDEECRDRETVRVKERCKVKGVCHPNSVQGCFYETL